MNIRFKAGSLPFITLLMTVPVRASQETSDAGLLWISIIASLLLLGAFSGLLLGMLYVTGRPASGQFRCTVHPVYRRALSGIYVVSGASFLVSSALVVVTGFFVAEETGRFFPITGILGFLLMYIALSSFILGYMTLRNEPVILICRAHPILALITTALVVLMVEAGVAYRFIGEPRLLYAILPLTILIAILHTYTLERIPVQADITAVPHDPGTTIPPDSRQTTSYTVQSAYFPAELQEKYTDIEYIGKGGIARVFRGKRRSDGVEVAIKVPISFDEVTGKLFLKEMRIWEELDHPNIVKLFAVNILPSPYVEMEFLVRSLDELKLPLAIDEAVEIVLGIAEGLAYAHEKGIIHRDIKPQNILLDNEMKPKMTDWGLGKLLADSRETSIVGFSLTYAAPEQIAPEQYGKSDARTDIYQIGVVFYELVTGEPPFRGTSIAEFSDAILHRAAGAPSEKRTELAAYDQTILKCLEKSPDRRFQTVRELISALQNRFSV